MNTGLETSQPDLAIPRVHLAAFQGPLDLLLYLISKHEVEIVDIPMAELCAQYEAALIQMKEMDLHLAADYILMAATLIHIKSRLILPTHSELLEDGEVEDPRLPLVAQLELYRHIQEAARQLEERHRLTTASLPPSPQRADELFGAGGWGVQADMSAFLSALKDVVARLADRGQVVTLERQLNMAQCVERVKSLLMERGSASFADIFGPGDTLSEVVLVFLAILELLRRGELVVVQEGLFAPIRLTLAKKKRKS